MTTEQLSRKTPEAAPSIEDIIRSDSATYIVKSQSVPGLEYHMKPTNVRDGYVIFTGRAADGSGELQDKPMKIEDYLNHRETLPKLVVEQEIGADAVKLVALEGAANDTDEAAEIPLPTETSETVDVPVALETEEGDVSDESLVDSLTDEVNNLQASLELSATADAKLDEKAHHVMGVLRTEFIEKLQRNLPINMSLVSSTKLQAQELLHLLGRQRATAQEQVESGIANPQVSEVKALVDRVDMNRRDHLTAARSAYNACGVLTNILQQLEMGNPVSQLLDMLQLDVTKVEQAVGNNNSRNNDLKTLLSQLKERVASA